MPTRLLLVRHGENPANLTKEFSHRKVDYSLTPKGLLQARQTAEALAGEAVAEVWTSPLKRAAETADEIARFHTPPRVLEELREMNVGDLETELPLDEGWRAYARIMRQWLAGNQDERFPNGESRRELCRRFQNALDQITRGKEGQTLVVVGHGGLFTHGAAVLCGIADERTFFSRDNHNCSISTLDVVREAGELRFELVDWANIAHLSGEAAVLVESVPEAMRVKNL